MDNLTSSLASIAANLPKEGVTARNNLAVTK